MEMNSPSPCQMNPRKLRFVSSPQAESVDEDDEMSGGGGVGGGPAISSHRVGQSKETAATSSRNSNNNSNAVSISPPYRKVRALRLFDTPATPKTILQKSSARCSAAANPLREPLPHNVSVSEEDALFLRSVERPRPVPLHQHLMKQQSANVNPFTPDSKRILDSLAVGGGGSNSIYTPFVRLGLLAHNKKRCRIHVSQTTSQRQSVGQETNDGTGSKEGGGNRTGGEMGEMHQAPKRLALQDTNISRYQKEFLELAVIGVGQFGKVYQCLNRLDGCIYAIKKSIKPVARSFFE